MICDWLANRECFFLGAILYKKINVFKVRWEKRSGVHTKDKRIRREISTGTKASPAKASLSEKLNMIEKPHLNFLPLKYNKSDNFSVSLCLSLSLSIYLYIIYICIVTPLCFNKWLLIVNREFFLPFSCQHSEILDRLCHPLSMDLSNTTWAQRGLRNKLSGNAYGNHGTKAMIECRDKHSTTLFFCKGSFSII